MNTEHVVLATDHGWAEVIDFGDDRWGFAIFDHHGNDLLAKGFADTEDNARICAEALAHRYICPDCRHAKGN